MEWPLWLRRRTGVEHLGPPSRFFARLTIALAFGLIVYVGVWNANHYPVGLGYDATAHLDYAHIVVREHHIPSVSETAEGVQPPLYYAVAGTLSAAGHRLFGWNEAADLLPDRSYRGAQYFNLLCVLGTALCVVWLSRILAPRREWVAAGGVTFVAMLPVVAKVEAMFHPENLNMLASAVATASATHLLAGRGRRRSVAALLGVALAAGLATRASTLFTLAAVILGFVLAAARKRAPWRPRWHTLAMIVAVLAAVGAIAVALQTIVFHRQPFGTADNLVSQILHPSTSQGSYYRQPFFHVSVRPLFATPYRSHFKNEAVTQTYSEIWGDWFGALAWSAYSDQPRGAALGLLKDQMIIGVIPTLLAVAGWLALCFLSLRRRPELTVVALLPVFAVGGYLYRSYLILAADGDLLKAAYSVTSVPAWALGFGLATTTIGRRSRLAAVGLYVLLAAFAILELRFMLYGIRDKAPIF